jgi:hypothetical protein
MFDENNLYLFTSKWPLDFMDSVGKLFRYMWGRDKVSYTDLHSSGSITWR